MASILYTVLYIIFLLCAKVTRMSIFCNNITNVKDMSSTVE